jgi:3-oxoacyl-[acyl-carrier protein] reductase
MADTLLRLANDRRTARLLRLLGLPMPVILDRVAGGYCAHELTGRSILLGAVRGARLADIAREALTANGATVCPWEDDGASPFNGAVLDASSMQGPADYRQLYDFFHPMLRRLTRNARVVILGDFPEAQASPAAAAATRGLEGFMRSLAKELGRRGSTANLLRVAPDGHYGLSGALPFFCSARCTYVDGQVATLSRPLAAEPASPGSGRLAGRIALVTGAARGIGAATAARLAEDGAHVLCLDMAADRDGLYETAARVGGTPFTADVADPATPERLGDFVLQKFGALDVVVHNAGITRDKTLANMKDSLWDQVVAINFAAILAIDEVLLARDLLRDGGRIVCLSSMGGIAGNYGQTNYAATKAALIGYVAAQSSRLAPRGITANAVAPGFIETRMTAAMPWLPREIGRRMSSLSQGGEPRDVAELITFLATPGAGGLSGNTLRVCGQGWLGA